MRIRVGQIVDYRLSVEEAFAITSMRYHKPPTGNLIDSYRSSDVQAGGLHPLLVTRVWDGGLVNGQLFLDGNDNFWITAAVEGTGPRSWSWPKEE